MTHHEFYDLASRRSIVVARSSQVVSSTASVVRRTGTRMRDRLTSLPLMLWRRTLDGPKSDGSSGGATASSNWPRIGAALG